MASRSRKRKLQLEALELRRVLDGNLTVSILDGNLVLAGDALANVATVEQLAPIDATGAPAVGGSFQIIPDENTSINQGKPGEALTISGVTGGVKAALGDGNDQLTVEGDPRFKFEYLKLDMGAGADVVKISDVAVAGALSVSSRGTMDGSVRQSQADRMYLKYEGVAGQRSSVDLSGIHVIHKLDIEGRGGADVSLKHADAASLFIKFDGIKGEAASATATLEGLKIGGDLSVLSRGVTQKVSAVDVQADAIYLKYDGVPGARSSADLSGIHVIHKLDIEGRGALDLSVSKASAADMFLKLDGIKGESALDKTSLDGVVVQGGLTVLSRNVEHKFSAGGVQADHIHIKYEGSAGQRSAISIGGSQIQHKLDIEGRGAATLSIEETKAVDMFLKLESVRGQDAPSSIAIADLDLDGRLDVASLGALNFSAQALHAIDMFLKISDVKSRAGAPPSGSHVALVDAVLSGQLQISTGAGDDTVLVSGTSVKGPARFNGGGGGGGGGGGSGGQDSLTLINDQFAVEPIIVGFESVTKKST